MSKMVLILWFHEGLDDRAALPICSQELGLSTRKDQRPFPELPVHDSFSIPVKGIEQRGSLPPDSGTIEFPVLA